MREVGHAIPVGTWWLNLARQVINADTRDFQTLGVDLAKRIGKVIPFDKSVFSRLVTGKSTSVTIELIDAMCSEFRTLPRPVYFARSYGEAAHMSLAVDHYEKTVGAELQEEAAIVALPARRRRGRTAAVVTPASQRRRSVR